MALIGNFGFYYALARAFGGTLSHLTSRNKLEIYKGTMPDDANDWVVGGPGSPSDLLVTFGEFTIINANAFLGSAQDIQYTIFRVKPSPNPVNATATGTAAWYAMYDNTDTEDAFLGEVTGPGGTGTLRLDNVSLTSGNPVTVTHWGIKFGT